MPPFNNAARVFVSSARGEHLDLYRRVAVDVCHRLELVPVNMEQFSPSTSASLEICYREIATCDIFVLIIGHRYGSKPGQNSLSYTELEYQRARSRGLPVYVFIADERTLWLPSELDESTDAHDLARFIAELRDEHTTSSLGSPEQFRENLIVTLLRNADARSAPPARIVTRHVPQPPTLYAVPTYSSSQPFVGRTAELAAIDEWAGSSSTMLVIEGIGGLGKSALVWDWVNHHATRTITGLSGMMWWSFYEESSSIMRFLQEAACYLTGRRLADYSDLDAADLLDIVTAALRRAPRLLVLDGFERLLTAYHTFDATKVRDDEVDTRARSVIEPFVQVVLHKLITSGPSKIIIASRLMPDALMGAARLPRPGVRHHPLPGLTGREVVELAKVLGVDGDGQAIESYFDGLGNHPLLVGAVCGLIREYRKRPGDFDAWRADPGAGADIRFHDLKLPQRQTRALAAALAGLAKHSRLVLECLAILPGGTPYETLVAINPLLPEPADRSRDVPDDQATGGVSPGEVMAAHRPDAGEAIRTAAALDKALADLEDRGLLMWNRTLNIYDLHPVIRACVHDETDKSDRKRFYDRVHNHFTALPPEDLNAVTSVEDLKRSITIFRALVESGRIEQAVKTYANRLHTPLYWNLGANATIIGLLEPLDTADMPAQLKQALAMAYMGSRQIEKYLTFTQEEITYAVADPASRALPRALHNYALAALHSRQLIATAHALRLAEPFRTEWNDGQAILGLHRSSLALCMGDVALARRHLDAARLAPRPHHPGFTVEMDLQEISIALREGTLSERDLDRLDHMNGHTIGQHKVAIEYVKCLFWLQRARLGRALRSAEELWRASRLKGVDLVSGLALMAKVIVITGNLDYARFLIEEALVSLNQLHVSMRPYCDIAAVLTRIGDPRAVDFATRAYRQAWSDGPPYVCAVELSESKQLLEELGAPVPTLSVVDPGSVKIPFQEAISALSVQGKLRHEEW